MNFNNYQINLNEIHLPCEREIISSWKEKKCTVSIICTSYNHEQYIEDAIRGFLIQKTSFPFEIIIHDDASSDKTQEIIKKYQKRYPNIIKPILQLENQYSQGNSPSLIAYKHAKGEFLAICEGDDYWIDINKLQSQYIAIKKYNRKALVVTAGLKINQKNNKTSIFCSHGQKEQVFFAQDVLNIRGQFAPTASYLITRSLALSAKEVFTKLPVGDLYLELYAGAKATIVYLPIISTVYRRNATGSWSENLSKNRIAKLADLIAGYNRSIELVKNDPDFNTLDWSIKLSAEHFNLAVEHLKSNNRQEFLLNIQKSKFYGIHSTKQWFYYTFRKFFSFLRLVKK